MKQVIQNLKTGKTEVIETPIPTVRSGQILVKTHASLVSAGTERNLVDFAGKSIIGKAKARPDLMKQVINKAKKEGILSTLESAYSRLDQPLLLGYSSAGTVVEVGKNITAFQPGDRVACAGGGHAVHAEYALIPETLAAKIPESVDFFEAAFATLGAIALNGIRLASPQIGDRVAVVGLGLLGLLTTQLVEASGCSVVGCDISDARLKFARKTGVNAFSNNKILKDFRAFTNGQGFDHVLICADSASDETVELAGQIARDRGTVISLGVVGLNLPRKIYFGKELAFRVSRSSGPGRYDPSYEEKGIDYPIGYVRWTEGRNLEAFLDLIQAGKINLAPLITHKFQVEQAEHAYDLITGKTEGNYLGVVLLYESNLSQIDKKHTHSMGKSASMDTSIRLGVIGAGNYAGAVFLPVVKKVGGTNLESIVSSTGVNAQHLSRKFGVRNSLSNAKALLNDPSVNTIAILTRHNSHADLTIDALKSGKHVYCEKPLGINKTEIDKIRKSISKNEHPYLMVGFNRRFAPYAKKMKAFFSNRKEAMFMNYRVNAGYLPPSHWLNDVNIGGGRLVGEGCHFVDFAIFMTDETPISVSAKTLPNNGIYSNDNFLITLQFSDGSICTVQYLSNGSQLLSKEYVEIFSGGKSAILNDFRELNLYEKNIKHRSRNIFRQDKGHTNAWSAFVDAIKSGGENPFPLEELFSVSYTTLAAEFARQTGKEVSLAEFSQ